MTIDGSNSRDINSRDKGDQGVLVTSSSNQVVIVDKDTSVASNSRSRVKVTSQDNRLVARDIGVDPVEEFLGLLHVKVLIVKASVDKVIRKKVGTEEIDWSSVPGDFNPESIGVDISLGLEGEHLRSFNRQRGQNQISRIATKELAVWIIVNVTRLLVAWRSRE